MYVARFISRPEMSLGKGSSDRQLFFLNGRPVDLPKACCDLPLCCCPLLPFAAC